MNVIDYIMKPKQEIIVEDSNNLNITIPDKGADRDVDVVIKNPLLLPLRYNNEYRIVSEYLLESGSLDIIGDDRLGTENVVDVLGDDSCVGLYRFNNNLADDTGNTTATLNGNESYDSGVHNDSFLFDGATNILIDYSQTQLGSFSLFVKTPDVSIYQAFAILKKGNLSVAGCFYKDNKIYFFVRDKDGNWNTIGGKIVKSGEWYHIVYNYDTNSQKCYINSEEIASATIETYATTDNILKLGNYVNDTRPFSGNIDQLRLFNKQLTPAEIKKVMME